MVGCQSETGVYFSDKVDMQAVGTVAPIQIKLSKQCLEYMADINVYSACLSEEEVVCKVITIKPAIIIVNQSKESIQVA